MKFWMMVVVELAAFGLAATAPAAIWANVIVKETEIFDGPTKGHRTIKTVRKGTRVQASNMPIEGYHKVRLEDGMIGWIRMEDLLVKSSN